MMWLPGVLDRRLAALVLAALTPCALALYGRPAMAQAIVFADGTFADEDWVVTSHTNDGGAVVEAGQVPSGGVPGAFRRITHKVGHAVPGADTAFVVSLHWNVLAVYDPARSGAVVDLCYEEDSRVLEGYGQGQGSGLALYQDGRAYAGGHFYTGVPPLWRHHRQEGLTADLFYESLPGTGQDLTSHPDFSASAPPITFGFFRSNSAQAPVTISAAIDNWRVEVNCGPTASPTAVSPTSVATPSATQTATYTATHTPAATHSATAAATAPSPTATVLKPTAAVSCVCWRLLRTVPPAVVADAVANPAHYAGWQRPMNPNTPLGPGNPRRVCLSLRNRATPYHALYNDVEWQVGCQ
jgi:hypothetical protein